MWRGKECKGLKSVLGGNGGWCIIGNELIRDNAKGLGNGFGLDGNINCGEVEDVIEVVEVAIDEAVLIRNVGLCWWWLMVLVKDGKRVGDDALDIEGDTRTIPGLAGTPDMGKEWVVEKGTRRDEWGEDWWI